MRLFKSLMSPGLRNAVSFSLKTLIEDSSCRFNTVGKRCLNTSFFRPASACWGISKFHTSTQMYCIGKDIQIPSVPQPKKRFQRKKTLKQKEELYGPTWSAVAYATAEGYNMSILTEALKNQDLYQCLPLPADAGNDLHLCFKGKSAEPSSHIYIFSEGSVVFWNVPEHKQKEMLTFLKPYEHSSYDSELVDEEKEDLDYTYSEDETRIDDGCIILNSKSNTDLYTYTFSNGLAQSVKLGVLEGILEKYSSSISWVTEKMKKGEHIKMSQNEVFVKRGELFSIRHAINLTSDLIDTPDFYWDRKDLEILYQQTCNYLDIPKRTRTMNVRLSYCSELVDLLVNHTNDNHHVRLEWMIIILIMVEVVFECIHFLERFTH